MTLVCTMLFVCNCQYAASMVECQVHIWNNGTLTLYNVSVSGDQPLYALPSGMYNWVTVSNYFTP